MSWSLRVSGGDLNLSSRRNGMGIVTGAEKTFQDLRNEIYEPMGTDPLHSEYGSLIDGGVLPNGQAVDSPIGSIINGETIIKIESEISRIISGQVKRQRQKIIYETSVGTHTFAPNELISEIRSIETKQIGDSLAVRVSLQMNNGQIIEFVKAAA